MTYTVANERPAFVESNLRTLWLVVCASLLVTGGVIGHGLYRQYHAIDVQEREQLANQARIVDENLSLRLITTNSALDSIRNELPWLLGQPNGELLANKRLQALASAMIGVRSFVFMNADGDAIASNRKELIGRNFRDSERFLAIRRGANPSALYVSAPFATPLGVYTMSLGKIVLDRYGKFDGLILAIVDPEFFRTLLNSLRYTQDLAASVAHGDGKLVFSTETAVDLASIDLSAQGDSFFNQHLKSGEVADVFAGPAAAGDQRLTALRTIRPAAISMDKPLITVISRAIPAIYANWHQQALAMAGLFAALVVASTLGLLLYQRRQQSYSRLLADQVVERDAAEQAARASEAHFRTLFDMMSEGFCLLEILIDATGRPYDARFVLANQAYKQHTSVKNADLIGRTVREIYPGFEQSWLDRFAKVVLTGEPAHFRERFGPLDRWLRVSAYRTQPGRLAALFSDVTENHRMLERLRQQAMVFNSTEEGVVITDVKGEVVDANPAFERITEYSIDELRGRNLRLLQSGRQDRGFYLNMWKTLTETGNWQGEIWNRRKSGDIYLEWISISAVHDDDGDIVNYVGTSIDISRMKHAQSELERLAHHDGLTDLPNRLLVVSRLDHAIEGAKRHGGMGAVLFIDLDGFKRVNDTFGHKAGDELLIAVGKRIKARLREFDTVGRLGGDEFLIVLDEIANPDAAATVAAEVIRQLCRPFALSGRVEARIGASVGIAIFPQDGTRSAQLIERADRALYDAKTAGRGGYRFVADFESA